MAFDMRTPLPSSRPPGRAKTRVRVGVGVSAPRPSRRLAPWAASHLRARAHSSVAVLCILGLVGSAPHPTYAAGPTPPLPTPAANFVGAGQLAAGKGLVTKGNTMSINQASDKAVLNWQNFNIAKGYTVNFNQPSSTSQTLNRIGGADPSLIYGQLNANGQVLLINQNGILFGPTAQVNVGALLASTLNVSDAQFLGGLVKSSSDAASAGNPVFTDAGGAGGITLAPGAEIISAEGGRVVLIGTQVDNQGSISTPGGQTILAAGNKVYLAASSDLALRGWMVEVNGAGLAANSTVSNSGQVSADRGNITLAGLVVKQNGTLKATSTVNANGSIYLVAGDTSNTPTPSLGSTSGFGFYLPNQGGTLTLGSSSQTVVAPDRTDTATITDAQTFTPGQINLVGKNITLQSGAGVVAHGGQVGVQAQNNPSLIPNQNTPPPPANDSRLFIDQGANIDVSGLSNVAVPVERNLVQVSLYGNALQDAPLQRAGFLHGKTVTVDVNQGSTLTDVTPYKANIARGIAEKSTAGGTINLSSEGDLVLAGGATLNVSGGSVAYQPGTGQTTKLLGADGKTYDIATAPKDVQYVGFANAYSYTDARWGVTQTWNGVKAYLPGYVQGANAGELDIKARKLLPQGTLLGNTVAGPYQRTASTLPLGGKLVLGDAKQWGYQQQMDVQLPELVFAPTAQTLPANVDPLTGTLSGDYSTAYVSPQVLTQGGINRIEAYSNGTVTVPSDSTLDLGQQGSLTVGAQAVRVDGTITGTAASINLQASNQFTPQITQSFVGNHSVTLGANAQILAQGNWVNDTRATAAPTTPTLYKGGSVTLRAFDKVTMSAGSVIDVSGGAWLSGTNKLTAGAGGNITLEASSLGATSTAIGDQHGEVVLGGSLSSQSLSNGGTLSIKTPTVTIAKTAPLAGSLWLTPDFFARGGFSGYNITGLKSLSVADGTQLHPTQTNLVFKGSPAFEASANSLASATQIATLDPSLRKATNLTLAVTDVVSGDLPSGGTLALNAGAAINADVGGRVALNATDHLDVLGNISAPAGSINLQLGGAAELTSSDAEGYLAGQVLHLGATAALSATGYSQVQVDPKSGLRSGQVLDGGQINLTANKGWIQADAGSVIDVHGVADSVDVHSGINGTGPTSTVDVGGAAGAINVHAREGIVFKSTLRAQAAPVSGAQGGTLSLGLDLFDRAGTAVVNTGLGTSGILFPSNDRMLTITDQPLGALPDALSSGAAQLSADVLKNAGLDNVSVASTDVITFKGDVSLQAKRSVTLDAAELKGLTGATVNVNSAYVALGNAKGANQAGSSAALPVRTPTAGNANFTAQADLIDLRGNSTWSGFGQIALKSSGDLRLDTSTKTDGSTDFAGSLGTTANLLLKAQQIYPTTKTQFTVNPASPAVSTAYTPGTVTLLAADGQTAAPAAPLSAGGSVTINATDIVQDGVLRAPLGQIALKGSNSVSLGDGSLTSVSAAGELIPYGSTQNGSAWVYSNSSLSASSVTAPPSKSVSVTTPTLTQAQGAAIDASGGGDLYAYEFVAGPGGSRDVLDPASAVYSYAILPSLHSAFAPIDHQYGLGASVKLGDSMYLSGIPGLAAGSYALLPARYALLPGAYAIQAVSGTPDLPANTALKQADGSYLVAGRLAAAGTDIIASRSSGYLLTPSSVVRAQSQYTDTYANAFFTQQAITKGAALPRLPADAGQLQFSVTKNLALGNDIALGSSSFSYTQTNASQPLTVVGIGGEVSIVAPQIKVVDQADPTDTGSLQLSSTRLNDLKAQTLILGATRTTTADGDQLSVGTQTVSLNNSQATALTSPELILAASKSVTLASGSAIHSAASTASISGNKLLVSGDGALLRASSGGLVDVVRSNLPANPAGEVTVKDHTSIQANSLVLDAAKDTQVDSQAKLQALSLTLSSSRISFGAVPPTTPGLLITNDLLAGFAGLKNLNLRSASTIDFYDGLSLGQPADALQSLSFDSAALRSFGGADKTIVAGAITLKNSGSSAANTAAPTPTSTGSNTLTLVSDASAGSAQVTFGAGDKTITGFDQVRIAAAGDVLFDGTGSTTLAHSGDLKLQAQGLISTAGATQALNNQDGAVNISATPSSAGVPASLTTPGLGGSLQISGTSITDAGLIRLPSGIMSLHATGPGADVELGSGAIIDAAGVAKPLGDTYGPTQGGSATLQSDQGQVRIEAGSRVDVSGAQAPDGSATSAAGTLNVVAPHGSLILGGTVLGQAKGGQPSGNFTADLGQLGNYSALNASLNAGGFVGAIVERVRAGDVTIAGNDTVRASSFSLSADQGNISVAGTIDTHGATGGDIDLSAGGDLTVASGALLDTHATAANSSAGNVTLSSTQGQIKVYAAPKAADGSTPVSVNLQGVSGNTAGVIVNNDGQLTLRAARSADNTDVAVGQLNGVVAGAKPVVVEAVKTYTLNAGSSGATLSNNADATQNLSLADGGLLSTDTAAFASKAGTVATRLGASGNAVQVRAGVEVDSTGDLTLNSDWDLHSVTWNSTNTPVNLTLRAQSNLIFNASLSDGFTALSGKALPLWTQAGGDSATLRLAAGADLTGANALSTVKPSALSTTFDMGNFILTPNHLVRTGDGNIDVAAARDIRLGYDPVSKSYTKAGAQASVIYTAGVPGQTLAGFNTPKPKLSGQPLPTQPAYPIHGGDIGLRAGQDIVSAPSQQLMADWLWRRGKLNPDGTIATGLNTTGALSTSWWVQFDQFQEGVGALGGGNVSVQAGNDITNLSVEIPTTGRLAGATNTVPDAAKLLITGGGKLSVSAGQDIKSAVFGLGRGQGAVTAGGSILADSTGSTGNSKAAIALIGDAQLNLSARKALVLESASDPTILPALSASTTKLGSVSYFFTSTANSSLKLLSAAGDITLNNNFQLVSDSLSAAHDSVTEAYAVLPANVALVSPAGSISLSGNTDLLPSSTGNLNLLAAQDIQLHGPVNVHENDPSQIANPLLPKTSYGTSTEVVFKNYPLPSQPLHQDDGQPVRIIADAGSIIGNGKIITLPKSSELIAGQDIRDFQLIGKNLNSADVTLLQAGRDIDQGVHTDTASNQLIANNNEVQIGGPGQLVALAGRNVNLGNSDGLITVGNVRDVRLPAKGAAITVAAGLGANADGQLAQPAIQEFISRYLGGGAAPGLVGFLSQFPDFKAQSDAAALASFLSADSAQQLALIPGSDALSRFLALPQDLQKNYFQSLVAIRYFARLPSDQRAIYVNSLNANGLLQLMRQVSGNAALSVDQARSLLLQANAAELQALLGPAQKIDVSGFLADLQAQGLVTAGTSYQQALDQFRALPASRQLSEVAKIAYTQLQATGVAHTTQGSSYASGYATLNTLFPGFDASGNALNHTGDINLFFSEIKTAHGGDINVLAPGGSVVVGLPNPPAQLYALKAKNVPVNKLNDASYLQSAAASYLGILAIGEGAIRGVAKNNFAVNQARVMTLQGGDILLWASLGDIDAGKGAKTVSSAPPPTLQVDNSGNVYVDASASVSGSGIGQLLTNTQLTPGSVDLVAPHGDVNAGEAGIRAAGNLNIAAVQVVGADNIKVGGTATGVPVSDTGAFAGALTSAGGVGDATRSATDMASKNLADSAQDTQRLQDAFKPSFVMVKLFCLGAECADD